MESDPLVTKTYGKSWVSLDEMRRACKCVINADVMADSVCAEWGFCQGGKNRPSLCWQSDQMGTLVFRSQFLCYHGVVLPRGGLNCETVV